MKKLSLLSEVMGLLQNTKNVHSQAMIGLYFCCEADR